MAALRILDSPRDLIKRRALFGLEFLDPVSGLVVSEGLTPSVAGLPPPVLTPSRRFAWRLDGPPVARTVTVALTINNAMYGPPTMSLTFPVEANDGTVDPDALLKRLALTTTALYLPPDGMTAAVGTLLKGGGSKDPLPGVEVWIELLHDQSATPFVSKHVSMTDAAGAFAAVVKGLTREKPDPLPGPFPGAIKTDLVFKNSGGTVKRFSAIPLRRGRVTYLTEPIKWTPDPP